MGNLELLANAIAYIETHIQEELRTDDIANGCYCSKSTLEKLFRNVNHISVRDYMIRRRMSLAARKLVQNKDISILDVALTYGYGSPETFCRAFQQVWNCKPSDFRKTRRMSDLFPRMNCPLENGDDYMSERRNFEISELYDLFCERKNCYFVCCDIKCLIPINEISHKAGDLAILKSLQRMNDTAGPNDIVFRIGGDEFAMLTDSEDVSYVERIAEKIRKKNGQSFTYQDKEIPLSLYVGIVKLELKTVRYDELFCGLHHALKGAKF